MHPFSFLVHTHALGQVTLLLVLDMVSDHVSAGGFRLETQEGGEVQGDR